MDEQLLQSQPSATSQLNHKVAKLHSKKTAKGGVAGLLKSWQEP